MTNLCVRFCSTASPIARLLKAIDIRAKPQPLRNWEFPMLHTDNLEKAVAALKRSLDVFESRRSDSDSDLLETIRSGVIQNFEVAYELSWKHIQRWIKTNRSAEEAENPRTRKDLFRLAAKAGLISDPFPWFAYGDARNLTSHVYSGEKADIVLQVAKSFLNDARYLLRQLIAGNG